MRRSRYLTLLPLLLSGCTSGVEPAPERVVEARTSASSAPRGPVALRRAMLQEQNTARAAVGVAPLAWSDTLARDARTYAELLATSGRFEHAEQPPGPAREGENLWIGTRGAYAYREMVGHWTAERAEFVNGVVPAFSRTGRWQDVAHYGQIVWRGTTQVGCAVANNRRDDVLVCRYAPAGNVVDERAY